MSEARKQKDKKPAPVEAAKAEPELAEKPAPVEAAKAEPETVDDTDLSWPELVKKYGYVQARITFPEVYSEHERKRTGQ